MPIIENTARRMLEKFPDVWEIVNLITVALFKRFSEVDFIHVEGL